MISIDRALSAIGQVKSNKYYINRADTRAFNVIELKLINENVLSLINLLSICILFGRCAFGNSLSFKIEIALRRVTIKNGVHMTAYINDVTNLKLFHCVQHAAECSMRSYKLSNIKIINYYYSIELYTGKSTYT